MTTNLALASIKSLTSADAALGTTSRTLGARFGDVINVKDYGAKGDSTTDDTTSIQAALNAAFGTTASPHGGNSGMSERYANRPVFFPAGHYKTTSVLTVRSVSGGHVYGAGSGVSVITNATSGATAFKTNGCAYTRFANISFEATGGSGTGSIAFDLDWDNTGTVALNANYFDNVSFGGEIGISIGTTGYMGSENVFTNCYFTNCAAQGLVTRNGNALDQTIIGGGASSCGTGYKVVTGSIQLIMNVGLAGNTAYDIDIESNCVNAIIGCRSESSNFIYAAAGTFSLISCAHHGNGFFINYANGSCVMTACQSYNGKIGNNAGHGNLDIRACDFNILDPQSITGAVNNGGGLIRLTTPTTGYFITGDQMVVAGLVGSGGLTAAANGTWLITVIDATHVDLVSSSFAGAYTSGGTIAPSATNHLRLAGNPCTDAYQRDFVTLQTASATLKRWASGSLNTNLGATGAVIITLPNLNDADANKPGTKYRFYVAAAQTLTIQAANNMTIRVAANVSAANGTVASNTVGNFIELECIDGGAGVDATKWIATSVVGTWTVT